MNPDVVIAIIEALMRFAADVPELLSAGEEVVTLLRSDTTPTADQMATISLGLDTAHQRLQDVPAP